MKHSLRTLACLLIVATVACAPEEPHALNDAHETLPPTNRIAIPATVRKNLGISFARAELRHVRSTKRYPGAFEWTPSAKRRRGAPLAGEVRLAVRQYQPVEAGDVLFRLRSASWNELAASLGSARSLVEEGQAARALAAAELERARETSARLGERLERLSEASLPDAELAQRRADVQSSLGPLAAELGLAERVLEGRVREERALLATAASALGWTVEDLLAPVGAEARPRWQGVEWIEVRAERPGVVEHLHVTDGSFVEAFDSVLGLVDPQAIRFRAHAPTSDLAHLTALDRARVVSATDDAHSIDASFTTALEADPRVRRIELVATPLVSAEWARAGVAGFLEVVIEDGGQPALAIPRQAVVQDGLVHVFFRRDPKNADEAIRVEADLGVDDGRFVEVWSGLRAGDEVVLDGVYELKLATETSGRSTQGGHFHADGTFHADE